MGVTSEDFYDSNRVAIVPMGFCFPGLDDKGGDLPPRPECAERWRRALFERLQQIDLVLLVGQYAQSWHLGALKQKTLTETVRSWRSILETTQKPRYLPLPHPSWRNNAWIRKNPWFEAELVPRLRREVRALI